MQNIQEISNDLLTFLYRSPTPWHAVENIKNRLIENGFTELREKDQWAILPGKGYFIIKNGSTLMAFRAPSSSKINNSTIIAAHTDSPGFKIKPNGEYRNKNMILLGIELYGAPLISSWLNRDLAIAGRVILDKKSEKEMQKLIWLKEHPVFMPQLAIHLDREVNEKGLLLHKQNQLTVVAAFDNQETLTTSYLNSLLKEEGCKHILDYDLFLAPLEPPNFVGRNKQMIASYRIDNLTSVHSSLLAFLQQKNALENTLSAVVYWDNEEIGSSTAQGASSPFFSHVLERVFMALKQTREEFLRSLSQSICVSVDLAHAFQPGYEEKYEPRHQLLMNKGIVIKSNAQGRYATDALSAAKIIKLANKHKIGIQRFVTRNDMPAGTTIGPIFASETGMPTVDIGTVQFSMHSAREICSVEDHLLMTKFLQIIFEESFS